MAYHIPAHKRAYFKMHLLFENKCIHLYSNTKNTFIKTTCTYILDKKLWAYGKAYGTIISQARTVDYEGFSLWSDVL